MREESNAGSLSWVWFGGHSSWHKLGLLWRAEVSSSGEPAGEGWWLQAPSLLLLGQADFQLDLVLCSGGLLEHEDDGGIPILAAATFVLAWRDCKFAPDSKEQRIQ